MPYKLIKPTFRHSAVENKQVQPVWISVWSRDQFEDDMKWYNVTWYDNDVKICDAFNARLYDVVT